MQMAIKKSESILFYLYHLVKEIITMEFEKGKTYVWHYDTSHAWLKVTEKELIALRIKNRITIYSYQRNGSVYLEKDHDAGVFIEAYMNATGEKYEFIKKDDGDSSKIREYASYYSPPFYDEYNEAWVRYGVYQRCGHPNPCDCYGKAHEGKLYQPQVSVLA